MELGKAVCCEIFKGLVMLPKRWRRVLAHNDYPRVLVARYSILSEICLTKARVKRLE